MKTAEYKQTGVHTEEYKVIVPAEYDDEATLSPKNMRKPVFVKYQ